VTVGSIIDGFKKPPNVLKPVNVKPTQVTRLTPRAQVKDVVGSRFPRRSG